MVDAPGQQVPSEAVGAAETVGPGGGPGVGPQDQDPTKTQIRQAPDVSPGPSQAVPK